MKKIVLRAFGTVGVFLFGTLLLLTFSNPQNIEKVGKIVIEHEVISYVEEKIDLVQIPILFVYVCF